MQGRNFAIWFFGILPISMTIGTAIAAFVWSLNKVTALRLGHPWLLFFLPVAGIGIAFAYHQYGKKAEAGNNLIMDEIHEPDAGVPPLLAPLVYFGTIVTHLFGGSSGREGTAVQIGGSIAGTYARIYRTSPKYSRTLLMTGIAAGFGAVFGTPLAGAIFALEVLAIGRMEYDALIPCVIASVIGDITCRLWGVDHTNYRSLITTHLVEQNFFLQTDLILKVGAAGVIFGLAGSLFAEVAHAVSNAFKTFIKHDLFRPVVGGIIIIGLSLIVGSDYLGLSESSTDPHAVTITSAFHATNVPDLAWFWKIIFTSVTLGSGFKGGEVTPMFFMGATLGNVLSGLFSAPTDLFAALGFVAIFAGATNTPLACTIMSVELFGSEYLLYFAIACFVAYFFSGHSGIYLSQRVANPKADTDINFHIPMQIFGFKRQKKSE